MSNTEKQPGRRNAVRAGAILLTAMALWLGASPAEGANGSCGDWTVNVKRGTFTSTDEVWWNGVVRFTMAVQNAPDESCTASNDGEQCAVYVGGGNGNSAVKCDSPTLRIDTTPPVCGDWTITTPGQASATWSPGDNVVFLPWFWTTTRGFSVRVSDTESGVPTQSVPYVWPSDSLADPIMQSSVLGDFGRITANDNAGNSVECVGPRKRVDGFDPSMPSLDCDNFVNATRPLSNPYQGEVKCGLSDSAWPSTTYVSFRVMVYNANLTTGAIGSLSSDSGWFSNGAFDALIDANGNRIRSGQAYVDATAPLRYAFTPTDNRITRVYGRLCEFTGTSGQRCTDSNMFEIQKIPPPPPIPATAGDGWYDCQDPNTGKIVWYAPDESVAGSNTTWSYTCGSDNNPAGDTKSKSKVSGNVAPSGSAGCWCYDVQPPTITSMAATPSTWTNQDVSITAAAGDLTYGGAPFWGMQYSCDNGSTWSTGSTASTTTFTCRTAAATAQTAKVRACDMASNCSAQSSVNYYIDKTAPVAATAANLKLTGKIKNWNGHSQNPGDSASSLYTYVKDVTLAFDPSDAGGSGLKSVRFSCNPTYQDNAWENVAAGNQTKAFDLTDPGYGCDSSEGRKTVYLWAKDNAGNVSSAMSVSILYDRSAPNFDVYSNTILLRALSNYTYQVQNPNDGANSSGIKDFSMTWIPETGTQRDDFNLVSASPPYQNDFNDLARYVNSSCDSNDDGKCVATIRITLEDNAGNAVTKQQRLEIIPSTVALMAGNLSTTSSQGAFGSTVADLSDRYSVNVHLQDTNGNVIRPITGLLEIRGDYGFENNATFLGNETSPANGNANDGAVWYNWDDGNWSSSAEGNTASRVYVGSNVRTDGNYTIQVKSSVPTSAGYPNLTRNSLRMNLLKFSNAVSGDAGGCPSGYVCTGTNANSTYGRILSLDLSGNAAVNAPLAYKPTLDVTPSKSWNTLSDNTWQDVKFSFKNNSTVRSFLPSKLVFDFRYSTYLANFAELSMRGDFGNASKLAEGTLKKFSFDLASGFTEIAAGATVTKTIALRANSYGVGFGSIGFTTYLPWFNASNVICAAGDCSNPFSRTGYNTRSLGFSTDVPAFDYLAAPPADSSFSGSQSFVQKFSANGQIADSGKNQSVGMENSVSIDAATMEKNQFKANVRKNVETIVRGLRSDNGSNCSVALTSLTKDLYYYDFSKLSNSTSINGNNGCVLTLMGQATGKSSGYRAMGITGKKTIIVRGGNVNIDTDMYYGDGKSILALIVLRDSKVRTKGGNVFVNPKVTNVVASAYAEGSLISYDSAANKVYDAGNTVEGDLSRQLLWYGSLFSANSIGGSLNNSRTWECPYGSDTYETNKSKTCTEIEATRYDFSLLRRFVLSDALAPDACAGSGKKSPKSTGTDSEKYAFAGKKYCFQTDANNVPELRSTAKTSSFVMEYNPVMQTSGLPVFSMK